LNAIKLLSGEDNVQGTPGSTTAKPIVSADKVDNAPVLLDAMKDNRVERAEPDAEWRELLRRLEREA